MKETGIIRHLDELGRIVIPKEIRKKLKIKNGDPVEIFTENESVIIKKYSPLLFDDVSIKAFIKTIIPNYNCSVIITDNEKIIYSTNSLFSNNSLLNINFLNKINNYINKEIPKELNLEIINNITTPSNCYISRIYADYEECGYVLVLAPYIRKEEIYLSNMIVSFINELLKFE